MRTHTLTTSMILGAIFNVATTAQHASPYGRATAGSGGIEPQIWIDGSPRLGSTTFAITLEGAVGGGMTAMLLGSGQADLPLLGARVLLDPAAPLFLATPPVAASGALGAPGVGTTRLTLPLPTIPSFEGRDFFAQHFILDNGIPGLLAASDGLRFTIRRDDAIIAATTSGIETIPASGPATLAPWPPSSVYIGGAIELAADGRRAILTDAMTSGSAFVWDVGVAPATRMTRVGPSPFGSFRQYGLAIHPTAPRGYVVYLGVSSGNPPGVLCSCDLDSSSPTFGMVLRSIGALDVEWGEPVISGDGRRLAVPHADHGLFRGLTVFDVDPASATRDQVVLQASWPIGGTRPDVLQISPHGDIVYLADTNLGGTLRVYDMASGNVVASTPVSTTVRDLQIDPRGRFLAAAIGPVGNPSSDILYVELRPGPSYLATRTISTGGPIERLRITSDGQNVVTASRATLSTWNVATGALVGTPITTLGNADITGFVLR